jgi:periplasmic divalent cation tolerance protein
MTANEFGVVTTTVSQHEDAERLAELVLSEKLAACVQILSIGSRYIWKGEKVAEPELMLLIKTRTSLFEKLMARIAEEHPYETPELVATPFSNGFAGYLDWITENTEEK